jgi:hypothetical protein
VTFAVTFNLSGPEATGDMLSKPANCGVNAANTSVTLINLL